jgi:sigma-B regulation protein RsbU (phosphoserine phosphatase)
MNLNAMIEESTILIIDDEPLNVKLLEAILKAEGYLTFSAHNGQDGRNLAKTQLPSLILLDVMMPGESGFDTCARLKEDPQTTDIPIIFISAVDDVASKVHGLDMGAVDYVTKPFEKVEVLARTRLHLKLKLAYKALIDEQAARLKQIRSAQQSILVKPKAFPDAKFGVNYFPVLEAGGDFYDVFPISDGIFGYFVADISGHDLKASYLTSALKALITQNANPIYTPKETIKIINSVLVEIMTEEMYLTACYAHLNRITSKLSIISAGHLPVIYLFVDGSVQCLEGKGDILGAFDAVKFDPIEKSVSKGDRFYLFTDGLVEGFGKGKKSREHGVVELMKACTFTKNMTINEAVSEIHDRLFPGHDVPEDDLLLIGVEV